jgi:uncharacterized membrane protein YtjA (UPF0391 family)
LSARHLNRECADVKPRGDVVDYRAAVLGFGGIAGAAVGIAKIVFFVALVLFVISLLAGGMRGGFRRRL